MSETISRLIVIFVVIMFIVFFSLALAIWLGQILGEMYLGFACVAAFYAVFGGSLFLFCRKWLKTKIANVLVNHFLN